MKIMNNEYKDPIFKEQIISKIINVLMNHGKKSIIEKKVYKCLQLIKKKKNTNPINFLNKAIKNIEPTLELKNIKIAGISYQIPFEVSLKRQRNIAIRWLVDSIISRVEKSLVNKLYIEIINAYEQKGSAYKKKDDIHRKAEANRTFVHYRW